MGKHDDAVAYVDTEQPECIMVSGSVAAAPVNPGSIPAATIISVNNAANQAMQTRTSVGAGIAPFLFVSNAPRLFSLSVHILKPFLPPVNCVVGTFGSI